MGRLKDIINERKKRKLLIEEQERAEEAIFIRVLSETEAEREAYERYINTGFSEPYKQDYRIASNIANFTEFDMVKLVNEDSLGGRLDKRYIMLDYRYFDELVSDMFNRGEDSGYQTYLNADNVKKYGIDAMPKNISTLVKLIRFSDNPMDLLSKVRKVRAEVTASRILNFFKAKTVFNQACFTDTDNYILSVDFIKPNQRYYSGVDIDNCSVQNTISIEKNLEVIEQSVEKLSDMIEYEYAKKLGDYNLREIKEQFIYSYLIRVYLLGDSDFCGRNCGFIVDTTTNTISFGPSYDFELSFYKAAKLNPRLENDFRYLSKNYPDILGDFMEVVESLSNIDSKKKVPKFKKIINKCVPEKEIAEEFSLLICSNIKTLKQKYKEITNESQLQ